MVPARGLMMMCRSAAVVALILLSSLPPRLHAGEAPGARPPEDSTLPPLFDPARHMRVSEVRPGMKGYGLSVFSGTKIDRFDVEVIEILRKFNPSYDVVLIKAKGQNLEHTGSVAGMSGSPIFLRDDQGRERMIGAFAYGWPLTKDPLAGVQPIEYMLRIPLENPQKSNDKGQKAGKGLAGQAEGDAAGGKAV